MGKLGRFGPFAQLPTACGVCAVTHVEANAHSANANCNSIRPKKKALFFMTSLIAMGARQRYAALHGGLHAQRLVQGHLRPRPGP